MKLIRCYIENFGGLQQYAVDFSQGLTVIHEPNGFGKTTLAEFIRAMFYGFPRANKDINKNPRLKYLPWQGGLYGGNLTFEHNGKVYRMERSFGETPKNDKFKLIDTATNKESRDFSAEIGNELFGLDADSFLRSTYMPQLRDNAPLSTDNIRAKLGNLLEDTGDMGSYEKALQRLKDKRTGYEHYRGNGGSIHEAQKQMTALQQEIDGCKAKEPLLTQASDALALLKQEQEAGSGELQAIRRQLSEATTAQAEAALSREYEKLLTDKTQTAEELAELTARYPKGIPTADALETASKRADEAAKLHAQLQETAADRNAAQTAENLEPVFAQGVPTQEEWAAQRTASDRLMTAGAELQSASLSAEEAQLLEQLNKQFAKGLPEEAMLNQCRQELNELTGLQHSRPALELPKDEWDRMAELEKFFIRGIPPEGYLCDCADKLETLAALRHRRPGLKLSEEEQSRLQELEQYFAEGVPEAEEAEQQEQRLNRADALRRENMQLSAAVPTEPVSAPAPQKKFHSLFFPALILGILAAGAGICLLTLPQILPDLANRVVIGAVSAALGGILLIVAAFLQNNHSIMSKLQPSTASMMSEERRRQIEENERNAAALEAEVAAFLAHYPTQSEHSLRRRLSELNTNLALYLPLVERSKQLAKEAKANEVHYDSFLKLLNQRMRDFFPIVPPLDEALQTIRDNKSQLLVLRDRYDKLRILAAENDARTQELTQSLSKALSPYFDTILSFDSALQTLDRRMQRFEELSHKQAETAARRVALTAEIAELEEKFSTFLLKYGVKTTADGSRAALDGLRADADSYTAAKAHLQQRAQALRSRDEALTRLHSDHEDFRTAYGLTIAMDDRQALKTLERDRDAALRLAKVLTACEAALDAFLQLHGHKPASALQPMEYDLNALKLAEHTALSKQNSRHREILQLEQRCRMLREEIDRIPALTDSLTRLTEQKADDTDRRRLLDSTVDFLQKARESLSASYLGGVQGHFAHYLNRLTGEETGHIAVNSDLEVQLERSGAARSLPHFSAGQTDAVHLCMRLALSDALFEDGHCFMILDDPFVNLDDEHTAQALELLRDLSEDRQIIYLVCNSSRTL